MLRPNNATEAFGCWCSEVVQCDSKCGYIAMWDHLNELFNCYIRYFTLGLVVMCVHT